MSEENNVKTYPLELGKWLKKKILHEVKTKFKNNNSSESDIAVKVARFLRKHQLIIGLAFIGLGLINNAFLYLGGWYKIVNMLGGLKHTQELLWYYRDVIERAHYIIALTLLGFGLFFLWQGWKEPPPKEKKE